MNHLGRTALVAVALVLLLRAPLPSAFGQIANNVKTAADVTAHRQTIDQFVNDNIKKLSGEDAGAQGDARDALVGAAVLSGTAALAGGGGQQPSPAYLDAYTQALDRALTPLANHPDMRVRLNAAIVTAKVADKANNDRLANAAIKFMNDKQPAVALWGVKAARPMLPTVLNIAGGQNPLAPALAQTVQRHALLANIITEVYDALTLNLFNVPSGQRPPPTTIRAAVPVMLRVYRMRVDGYAGGLPPDPSVDNIPAEWLAFQPVWSQMTPAQQLAAVQTIDDLLGLLGQHAELMSEDERTPMLPVFRRTGKALQAIADANNLPQVSAAAKVLQNVTTGTDGGDVRKATVALVDALKKAPQFATLKPAPEINILPPEPDVANTPEAGTGKGAPAPGATNGNARKAGGPEAAPAPGNTGTGAPAPAPAPNTGKAPAPPPLAPAPAPGPRAPK